MTNPTPEIDFYCDPLCPFAYQTSLWLRDVRRQTGLVINWRFFSLEENNRPDGDPHAWERDRAPGWTALRVAAFLRRRDVALCDAWFAACGKARHEQGRKFHDPDVARELLVEIGAEAGDYDAALADETTSDDVRADHVAAVEKHAIFGVPTLLFAETPDSPAKAVFGPVILPAPLGAAALNLWDITARYARFPGLYELKTTRTSAWQEDIGRVFSPARTR